MIDIRKLKELVRLMVENDLTELDLQDQQETVTVKRGPAGYPVVMPAGMPMMGGAAMPAPAVGAGAGGGGGGGGDSGGDERDDAKDTAGLEAVTSPMVGTVYLTPSPDSPPFVTVGASVGPDTTVCLIEAMKVFSEIKAEKAGVVERIVVGNGQAVQFGQQLVLVKPN